MINSVDFHIKELDLLKNYPKELFYKGNIELLKKRKVSIVGTRHPFSYSAKITNIIASSLAKRDIFVVSGAAIGIDAIAHKAAEPQNTIAVVANGLNIKYPAINAKLIEQIEEKGLILSCYKENERARNYTFVQRNEIVVALGEVLIVAQADENSGTLTSIKHALNMGKKVYTIPHRLEESKGTQEYLKKGLIEPIYDLDEFLNSFGDIKTLDDELLKYLNSYPSLQEALALYKDKIYELELEGLIRIENGSIKPI